MRIRKTDTVPRSMCKEKERHKERNREKDKEKDKQREKQKDKERDKQMAERLANAQERRIHEIDHNVERFFEVRKVGNICYR